MQYPIIINDKSCSKFAQECKKIYKGQNVVVAIGGGTVIDKGKILALPFPCIAYPTTMSGAAMTSHAVVWANFQKLSITTPLPICKKYPYKVTWTDEFREETFYDALAHCIDSLESIKATPKSRAIATLAQHAILNCTNTNKLIEAGNLAGQAIDITGTGIIHQLSYPLTIHLGYSHGKACKTILSIRGQL